MQAVGVGGGWRVFRAFPEEQQTCLQCKGKGGVVFSRNKARCRAESWGKSWRPRRRIWLPDDAPWHHLRMVIPGPQDRSWEQDFNPLS